MRVEATIQAPRETDADTVVIGLLTGEEVTHDLPDGSLAALRAAGEASDTLERTAVLHHDSKRYVTVGLGARDELTEDRMRAAAAAAAERAGSLRTRILCWEVPHKVGDGAVAAVVEGTLLRDYRYDRYRPASPDAGPIERLIVSAHHDVSEPALRAAVITEAQNRARDLGNTPANDLGPAALAEYTQERFAGVPGARVRVLGEREIREAGMGAFAAVAQGSARDACLIEIELSGPAANDRPQLALIGKAVTFDSGGLSLKPAASMHEMKFDMLGGAAVIEAMGALAELGSPVGVLGLIGATENLPSGAAIRPGDIVRALDGTTIEVNNTDAEGRLVLADLICHARRSGAERIVDLATLTGGAVIALGSTYAALFANHDDWADTVLASASRTGEHAWRLPLHPEYAEMVKGRYGQLTNRAERREAMAIAGAEFLHHFAGETPWAHLDIAGTAYDVKRRTFGDRGATGYGVRLLVDLVGTLSDA